MAKRLVNSVFFMARKSQIFGKFALKKEVKKEVKKRLFSRLFRKMRKMYVFGQFLIIFLPFYLYSSPTDS